MKRIKTFYFTLLPIVMISCTLPPTYIQIPEPQVKSTINAEISLITNISTNYMLELSYLTNLLGKAIETFDFSKYTEETTSKTPQQQSEKNLPNVDINLDEIIKNTIEKRLKKFIKQLRTYNPTLEEITILNITKIEEELLRNKLPFQKTTNYITNITFETNYYISKTDTNKVEVEIIQKETIVSEIKIKEKELMSYIYEKYPWILNLTNGIRFSEGSPPDFSIYTFYDIYEKGRKLEIVLLVSNNLKSNFIMMRTNMDVMEFLSSDEKMFNELKHFFYNYQSALLVIETDSNEHEVFIDDIYLGRGNRLSEILCKGLHKITFSKNTHKFNDYVYLEKGKINVYRKNLKSEEKESTQLSINTIPSNADIFIENKYFGKSPTNIVLPKGKYRVWLNKGELETFKVIELFTDYTNITFHLQNPRDTIPYNIMSGITILFATATISSTFLYFWADSQERYYDFLYQKEKKPEHRQMQEYYYYFKDNMRTVAITGAIATFVLWGVTLGIESDKFSIQLTTRF